MVRPIGSEDDTERKPEHQYDWVGPVVQVYDTRRRVSGYRYGLFLLVVAARGSGEVASRREEAPVLAVEHRTKTKSARQSKGAPLGVGTNEDFERALHGFDLAVDGPLRISRFVVNDIIRELSSKHVALHGLATEPETDARCGSCKCPDASRLLIKVVGHAA